MKMPVLNIPSKGARFNLLCMMAALLTYMSLYAFRKSLSAATFEGITYWGLDYKIIAISVRWWVIPAQNFWVLPLFRR